MPNNNATVYDAVGHFLLHTYYVSILKMFTCPCFLSLCIREVTPFFFRFYFTVWRLHYLILQKALLIMFSLKWKPLHKKNQTVISVYKTFFQIKLLKNIRIINIYPLEKKILQCMFFIFLKMLQLRRIRQSHRSQVHNGTPAKEVSQL